jgi:hypothetical protein
MHKFKIGDLIVITRINAWAGLRDADEGKIGVIVGIYYDWHLRADILYIQIDNKRKGFYFSEIELLCRNES